MIKKIIIISLLIFWLIVFVILGIALTDKNSNNNISVLNNTNQAPVIPAENALTVEKIALHNKQNDCWVIIFGNVYDVTEYILLHPGGAEAIISYCGKDGTTAFKTKDQNPGKPHSQNAQNLLNNYYLGKLGEKIASTIKTNSQVQPAKNKNENEEDD